MSPDEFNLADDQDLNQHAWQAESCIQRRGMGHRPPTMILQSICRRMSVETNYDTAMWVLHGEERRGSAAAAAAAGPQALDTQEQPENKASDGDGDFDMFADDFDEDKYAAPEVAPESLCGC